MELNPLIHMDKSATSSRYRYSKKRTIIFPTRLNLEKLSQSNTVEEALENARNSKIVTVTPSISKIEGEAFLTIPEKAGYGLIKEPLKNL